MYPENVRQEEKKKSDIGTYKKLSPQNVGNKEHCLKGGLNS